MQRIATARRGRGTLRLNLFDDEVVEVQIERVRPTRSGYYVSGHPIGAEWGEARLVANGPVLVGTVVMPGAKFTIRSSGFGRLVIREIDPSMEALECEMNVVSLAVRPERAISFGDQPVSPSNPSTPPSSEVPTEDGSEIRILVLYTRAMQSAEGGPDAMTALVDLLVQSANEAFEEGGITPRLVLAHSEVVDYVAQGVTADLARLSSPDDGHLDGIHALRNEHAADLVHLLTGVGGGGSALRLFRESVSDETGFAVMRSRSEEVYVHELGHNLGLVHDRYEHGTVSSPIYHYAYGYVNKRAFGADARDTARWRTIMSYNDRCRDAGFDCEWLLRFSNPDQTYRDDPMGVAADDPAEGVDGPADARMAVNNSAPWVASFRSEACTDFNVSPDSLASSLHGGELVVEVQTTRGCLWEASSDAEFVAIASDSLNAGPGQLRLTVEPNDTGVARSATLTVAGEEIPLQQFATTEGVCGRTNAVLNAITRGAGFSDPASCDEVTDEDLAGITSLSVKSQKLTSLRSGDFEGLTGLEQLDLERNLLAELPEDLFKGLSNLKELNLHDNRLAQLSAGQFEGLGKLEELDLGFNRLSGLPPALFEDTGGLVVLSLEANQLGGVPTDLFSGLSDLRELQLSGNELVRLAPQQFSGVPKLQKLELAGNRLGELPESMFAGLPSLEHLDLQNNELYRLREGLFAGRSALSYLDLANNRLTRLPEGLLNGLASLEFLSFYSNRLTQLGEGAFRGMSSLEELRLDFNRLTVLPDAVFSDLSMLEHISLVGNRLTELPQGVFSGVANLRRLDLSGNRLAGLPSDAFSGLAALRRVDLGGNELAGLSPDVFSGLAALEHLDLSYNQLSRLPDGIFSGLTALDRLFVNNNRVEPLLVNVGLEKVGVSEFKASAPTGAPFAIELSLSVGSGGTIDGDASTLTIAAGAIESAPLEVGRLEGSSEAVSLDLATLPGLPAGHFGFALHRDASLPLWVLGSIDPADAALIGLATSNGVLDPAFTPHTTSYRVLVGHAVSSITVSPTPGNQDANVVFLDIDDEALPDADPSMDGHQVGLGVGENTVKVKVASEDASTERTYTLVVTRDVVANVCRRTSQVREAIVRAVAAADACGDLTLEQLTGITDLNLSDLSIRALAAGDLAGLGGLKRLGLNNNSLRAFPAELFAGLTQLEDVDLSSNELSVLPPDVFGGLAALDDIDLSYNRLSYLHPGIFSDLASLRRLDIYRNRLESLPPGVFSGLQAVERLDLSGNLLSELPDGLFSGMTSLTELNLEGNAADPLRLSVSLQKVGDRGFKATAATGAPFTLQILVSVSSAGTIDGGSLDVTIPVGGVESERVNVTRVEGSEDAVAADIGILPDLPQTHLGYVLIKHESLPTEILAGPKEPAPAQVMGLQITVGVEQLALSWTAVSDAGGYKVQWKSDEEDFGEMRQAVLTGRETTSYTITGLVAGTTYGVRVIATRENAGDGPASILVTGTPRAASPGQVPAVEVIAGVERLEVSWTEVAEADGYRVQWKSGEAAYGDSTQTVLTGPETRSYTILGLMAGVEYTVRVISLKTYAEDGPPSAEVTGIPKARSPDQVMGVSVAAGVGELLVSWTPLTDADGYKVQWKAGGEDYDEERQVEIEGGDTGTHTIKGLSPGTEYTVRVIAVMEHAEDGLPSQEVVGVPKSAAPGQVVGVALTARVEQLSVSWAAVSDADGYKVQWKSGEDDYDEARQVVVSGASVVSYTIDGLLAGTEYRVRVIATRANADDGAPSQEVVGVPKAEPPAQVTGVGVYPAIESLLVFWSVVSDADGYKVEWKSGAQDYSDSRRAVIEGGDTVTYVIANLVRDRTYTIRVIASKDNADDGVPSDEVTGTPLSVDLNSDGVVNGDDAQIMYQSYAAAHLVGDGDSGGTVETRQSLLAGYAGKDKPSDDEVRAMIRKANAWKQAGLDAGGDINGDGVIDQSDALVLYHAWASESLIGDGTASGAARFRRLLLSAAADKENPSDEDLNAMLRRANDLREAFGSL